MVTFTLASVTGSFVADTIEIDRQTIALEDADELVQLRLRGDPRVYRRGQRRARRIVMVVPFMGARDRRAQDMGCDPRQRSNAAHAAEQPEWAEANRKHQATPYTHARPRGGRSRRRLGYAGATRRSAQPLGLDALKTPMRQAVDSARDGA